PSSANLSLHDALPISPVWIAERDRARSHRHPLEWPVVLRTRGAAKCVTASTTRKGGERARPSFAAPSTRGNRQRRGSIRSSILLDRKSTRLNSSHLGI